MNVTQFVEYPGKKDYIQCEILCERESHKHILKGAKSSAIKAVCTAARADIEAFLNRAVYLDTQVKVQKGWRSDHLRLRAYGY